MLCHKNLWMCGIHGHNHRYVFHEVKRSSNVLIDELMGARKSFACQYTSAAINQHTSQTEQCLFCAPWVWLSHESVFITQILLHMRREERNNLIYPLLRLFISRFIYLFLWKFFVLLRLIFHSHWKEHTTTLWAAVWFVWVCVYAWIKITMQLLLFDARNTGIFRKLCGRK